METAQACDILIDSESMFGHCGIVTGSFNGSPLGIPKGSMVIHATIKGVIEDMWRNGKAFCYRAKNLNRQESLKIQRTAERIKAGADYSIYRAVFKSWAGSSAFEEGALDRLKKYRDRLPTDQTIIKNVYCSELVIVAYQLGLNIDQSNRSWIDLDGKHSLPSTLKSWLDQHPDDWCCKGIVTDETLTLSPA